MNIKEEGKKVVEKADAKLTSLTELVTRKGVTKWVVLAVLVLLLLVVGMALATAHATGYGGGFPGEGASAISGASAVAAASAVGVGGSGGSATGGAVSVGGTSVNTRAYGGGSTGLAATARCLQSFGFAFNAFSATYADKNCIGMEVANEHCGEGAAGAACRKANACANPDVPEYTKAAIGCK